MESPTVFCGIISDIGGILGMLQMDWKPDKALKTSVKSQIIDFVIDKIQTGEWPAGALLPSQRELETLFDMTRSTIFADLGQNINESKPDETMLRLSSCEV